MKHIFLLPLTCLLMQLSLNGVAQERNVININIDKGLPSNRAYGAIRDRYGYLWMGTDKGVVKYNGYDFRVFTLSDGLPTEDVWEVLEDKKGRVWLGTITDEIGYIYKDKYHKAALKNIRSIIYPECICNFGSSIMFNANLYTRQDPLSICVENNDTIYKADIFKATGAVDNRREQNYYCLANNYDRPVVVVNSRIYRLDTPGKSNTSATLLSRIDDSGLYASTAEKSVFLTGNFIVSVFKNERSKEFMWLNMLTGRSGRIKTGQYGNNDDIEVMYLVKPERNIMRFCVKTKKNLLLFRVADSISYAGTFAADDVAGNIRAGIDENCQFFNDPLWGACAISVLNGVDIYYNNINRFKKKPGINLTNYTYTGGIADSINFWWNRPARTLCIVQKGLKATYYKYGIDANIYEFIPYSRDTLLALGREVDFFVKSTGKLIMGARKVLPHGNIISAVKDSDGFYYIVAKNKFFRLKNTMSSTMEDYDLDRYEGMVSDPLRKTYWAYTKNKIFRHGPGYDSIFSKDKLSEFGIKKIEKIVIDKKYGNVFIKGINSISLYDPASHLYKYLFTNYNHHESSIYTYRDLLVVTGRFGVLFSKITGAGTVSSPTVYLNIKDINYKHIYEAQLSFGKILLNTDKGTYEADIPEAGMNETGADSAFPSYRFILNYNGDISRLTTGDTVTLNQKNPRLQFDVINPYGNGKVRYSYKLNDDTTWNELNSNEITLPANLETDDYHLLTLKASDNVINTEPIRVYLYITPYWWQTEPGKKVIFSGITAFGIILISLVVLITRKLVNRNHIKRNLKLEVELKSIYAQINPHFIFNTLSTGLYFIKKNQPNEAYIHISKFSRLLRSYIKSSRNKYISVEAEIENLTNYIQLQQARFEDKFEFEIIADAGLSLNRVMIPSLLLQPIVENAIDHGLFHKEGKGHLRIEFRKVVSGNEVLCIIDDDGIGRKRAKAIADESIIKTESYGESLIAGLVTIFNQYEKINISIKYVDKQDPETGTTVIISIKNPLNEKQDQVHYS